MQGCFAGNESNRPIAELAAPNVLTNSETKLRPHAYSNFQRVDLL